MQEEGYLMSISCRDLKVWQHAMRLVLNVYTSTAHFPNEELYGLVTSDAESGSSLKPVKPLPQQCPA